MSMIGHLYLLPRDELEAAIEDPPKVHDLISRAFDVDTETDRFVDLDKAWHCLHFLLTGTAWEGEVPLDFIAIGGSEIGEEDVGYGPARGFRPEEVAAIASALEPVSVGDLVARFDGARMDELEIYPLGGWRDINAADPEQFGYFAGAFDEARALCLRGRDRGLAMIVWLS